MTVTQLKTGFVRGWPALLGAACLIACGSSATGGACTWDASLDATDGSSGACRAKRFLLECALPEGATEDCLSDDATHCPDSTTAQSCHDKCGANEYSVACGSIGPGPSANPPQHCHESIATPGGVVFYCCSCGS